MSVYIELCFLPSPDTTHFATRLWSHDTPLKNNAYTCLISQAHGNPAYNRLLPHPMSTWGVGDNHDSDEVRNLKEQLRTKGMSKILYNMHV